MSQTRLHRTDLVSSVTLKPKMRQQCKGYFFAADKTLHLSFSTFPLLSLPFCSLFCFDTYLLFKGHRDIKEGEG